MSDSEATIPFTDLHILGLLQYCFRLKKPIVVCWRENQYWVNDKPLSTIPPLPKKEVESRIRLLFEHWGIVEISLEHLKLEWALILKSGQNCDFQYLLEEAKHFKSESNGVKDDLIEQWRQTLLARMALSLESMATMDTFPPEMPPNLQQQFIETDPLFRIWPNKILNDRKWAYLETPFDQLPPLPLEQAWVDLHWVDPDEWTPSAFDHLKNALDHRYEEQQWFSEPLKYMLERFRGSAVLMGSPGSGKTTFLKWTARSCIQNLQGRYLLPLWIPLRHYCFWLQAHPHGNLVEFGLSQAGITDAHQQSMWYFLLKKASGSERQCILLLIDGWDEVPSHQTEAILATLEEISVSFATLITSRPSAYPRRLKMDHFYEISELAPEGIHYLVNRWFQITQQPQLISELLNHLDRSPDIKRLARNPFLLSLLCGVSWLNTKHRKEALPKTRSELYQMTLGWIIRQFKQRYGNQKPFGKLQLNQIRSLALWLFEKASDAPRYVFGQTDIIDSGGHENLLQESLLPSRLLDQLEANEDSHHFIHTTFQEFLAAEALIEESPDVLVQRIQSHMLSGSWQEVFHFLAGKSEMVKGILWKECKKQVQQPDRFGFIFIRLAYWLSEAGETNGGQYRLGIDIREPLWDLIKRFTNNHRIVDAYAQLDAQHLASRIHKQLITAGDELRYRLIRTLGRIHHPQAIQSLVETVLDSEENENDAGVALFAVRDSLDQKSILRFRKTLQSGETSLTLKRRALRVLGYVQDYGCVSLIADLFHTDHELQLELIEALGRIGGAVATQHLENLLHEPSMKNYVKNVINALGHNPRNPIARKVLQTELAACPLDDPLVSLLLDALLDFPLHHEIEVIEGFLATHYQESLREAAAWTLVNSPLLQGSESIRQTAQSDSSTKVRIAALGAFRTHAQPDDVMWLCERVRNDSLAALERANALTAILEVTAHHRYSSNGEFLTSLVTELVTLALKPPKGDLAYEAINKAHLAGTTLIPLLIQVCESPKTANDVRESTCKVLGKIGAAEAIPALLKILRLESNTKNDEDEPQIEVKSRLAQAAAEAITKIDSGCLLKEPGTTALNALAQFSFRTGCLVFEEKILDPLGEVIIDLSSSKSTDPFPTEETLSKNKLPPGLRLKIARELKGYTQEELTDKDGFPQAEIRTIRRWEKEGVSQRQTQKLKQIAAFYGLELWVFIEPWIDKELFEHLILHPDEQDKVKKEKII